MFNCLNFILFRAFLLVGKQESKIPKQSYDDQSIRVVEIPECVRP